MRELRLLFDFIHRLGLSCPCYMPRILFSITCWVVIGVEPSRHQPHPCYCCRNSVGWAHRNNSACKSEGHAALDSCLQLFSVHYSFNLHACSRVFTPSCQSPSTKLGYFQRSCGRRGSMAGVKTFGFSYSSEQIRGKHSAKQHLERQREATKKGKTLTACE